MRISVYDPVIQALSGWPLFRPTEKPGGRVRTIIPDKTTAVTAAQAITAALSESVPVGQHIRLAMLDTMVAYPWPEGMGASLVGKVKNVGRNCRRI